MALLDKVLGKDEKERQLEKEIRSLELRKESVFSAINGEIARLQGERRNVLLDAGTTAFDTWSKDHTQADLTEFWSKVQDLDKAVQEQEAKRTEMGIKYDEEISLINSNLNRNAVNAAPTVSTVNTGSVTAAGKRCPKCGAVVSGSDVFCQGCGTKLQ